MERCHCLRLLSSVFWVSALAYGWDSSPLFKYLLCSIGFLWFDGTCDLLLYFGISFFGGDVGKSCLWSSVCPFLWSLQLLPNMLWGLRRLVYYLMHHKYLPNRLNYFYEMAFPRLYTFDLRKDPFSWLAPFVTLVSGLLLFGRIRKYQTLSLGMMGVSLVS